MNTFSVPGRLITLESPLSKEEKYCYITLLYLCSQAPDHVFICTPEQFAVLAYYNERILSGAFEKMLVLDLYGKGFIEINPAEGSEEANPNDYPIQMFYNGIFRYQTWLITVNDIVI